MEEEEAIRVLIMSRREHGGEKADQVRARCVPASHWPTYACGAQPDKAAESHASRRPRWTARGRPPRAERGGASVARASSLPAVLSFT